MEALLGSGECVQDALHDKLLSARNAAYIERLDGLLFHRQVALADDDPCWTSLRVLRELRVSSHLLSAH